MKKAPQKTAEKSANDWLAEIMSQRIPANSPDEVPEGWMTLKQMCKATGVSEPAMRVRINRLLENGNLQRKQYKIWTGHQLAVTWHYHP